MKSLHIKLNRDTIKIIALISMILDHIGAFIVYPLYLDACIVNGINLMGDLIPNEAKQLYCIYLFLRIIGRLAFSIFAFFIVEGFLHTHNLKKYLLRIVAFAFISEIPYNLANTRSFFAPFNQNVLWTFAISIDMIWILEKYISKKENDKARVILTIITVGVTALCGFLSDGGMGGILLIASMYLFREKKYSYWIGCILSLFIMTFQFMWIQLFAVVALILLETYNGERVKGLKYLFYVGYPVHLLILWVIALTIA